MDEEKNARINDLDFINIVEMKLREMVDAQDLPNKFKCNIDDPRYVTMARTELECLQLLLRENNLEIVITKEDEEDKFCFTLYNNNVSASSGHQILGHTTCVIMGHTATTVLQQRSRTAEYQENEMSDAEIPVVKMEFTRLHVNGFKGAEIIQRYIMCLCARGGVHAMSKDIMTDLAGFIKDWNNNIGCFPEEFALSRTKFFDALREASFETFQSSLSSQGSIDSQDGSPAVADRKLKFNKRFSASIAAASASIAAASASTGSTGSSSGSSSSWNGSTLSSTLSSSDPYHVQSEKTCNTTYIPEINAVQAKELVNYFVFQYNDEIQYLLKEIKKSQNAKDEQQYSDTFINLQRCMANAALRVKEIVEPLFDDMYIEYYNNDDTHNGLVDVKKTEAKAAFQAQLQYVLDGIEFAYTTSFGDMPDYDSSPEALLIINKLFERDFIGGYFKDNLIDIARRIRSTLNDHLDIDGFSLKIDDVLSPKKRIDRHADGIQADDDSKMQGETPGKIKRINPGFTTGERQNTVKGEITTQDEPVKNPVQALGTVPLNLLGNSKRKPRGTRFPGGGNPTKKKQHKNKRSSKRKKNKKRATKTQKNKRNKTRK